MATNNPLERIAGKYRITVDSMQRTLRDARDILILDIQDPRRDAAYALTTEGYLYGKGLRENKRAYAPTPLGIQHLKTYTH